MPKVRLEDVVDIVVFRDLQAEYSPELTAFVQSGVAVRDPLADALANADGQTGILPYWLDLDKSKEPNYSSDQDVHAAPDKVRQVAVNVRKAHLNNGWAAMDLARELQTGVDAMRHIRNRIDNWWAYQWQRRIIATIRGLLAANIAGNFVHNGTSGTAGDMVVDISRQDGVNATSANKFSRSALAQAVYTMGDHANDLRAILVHSAVMKTMVDNDDIEYIEDSKGNLTVPTYMGLRVIVDDDSPVIPGATTGTGDDQVIGSGFRYVCTIFGAAAIAYGEGTPIMPFEIERQASIGHGGGDETLWTRKTWIIQPAGHDNTGAVATGPELTGDREPSQKLADLMNAANWKRAYYRKNVPLAFLIVNA